MEPKWTFPQLVILTTIATIIGYSMGYKKGLKNCNSKPKDFLKVSDGKIE